VARRLYGSLELSDAHFRKALRWSRSLRRERRCGAWPRAMLGRPHAAAQPRLMASAAHERSLLRKPQTRPRRPTRIPRSTPNSRSSRKSPEIIHQALGSLA
jgi:hypothetical protein